MEQASTEQDRQSKSSGYSHCILLVDDSPVNLGVVVENLELQGYEVLVAQDGEEAIQRARNTQPDIILLDVMMPGIDGFDVCRSLKEDKSTSEIPVIFMTSLGRLEDKIKGFAAGAVDYVTKPLQMDEVRARIGVHLELRRLQKGLEEQNAKLREEIAERERAESGLMESVERIMVLNGHLEQKSVELEASREQIWRTEAWYRNILHSAPDGMLIMDAQGVIMQANAMSETLFGYSEGEMQGKRVEMLLPSDKLGYHEAKRRDFISGTFQGRPMAGEIDGRVRRKDGYEFHVDVSLSRLPGMDGKNEVFCAAVRDITERKRMERQLGISEQKFRALTENSPDNISRYNRDCQRTYANQTYAGMVSGGMPALLGKRPSECPGGTNADIYEQKIAEIFVTGVNAEFELKWPDKDGNEICSHVRLVAERGDEGNVMSVLAVGRDITELNEHRQRVYRMAFYDTLTSLPNRALLNDRLGKMLADALWHGHKAGVMMLDLDHFKGVNDTLGHTAGDELLREVAARLGRCVRTYDTVARLGGDEFAVLLPDVRSGEDLGTVASKMLESFNEPFWLGGREIFVNGSIGIALYPDDGKNADDLLKQADAAMYFAKNSGRSNFRFYSKELTDSAHEKLTLESDLRGSFKRNELELYFQPKINLANGAFIGSEALLRWNHPQRGMVMPDKFIHLAEDSGLIVDIGEWVLRNACRVAREWNEGGRLLHKIAVNLSPRQFFATSLVDTVRTVLEETGCHPEWLELEITESLLLDEDGEVLEMLATLRKMGITIAIDDFGTGYSALSYLARFPIDVLKIDRSFTSRVTEYGRHTELVKAIISMAHSLKLQVVAEGVETVEHAEILRAYGCQIAQGYLYGKPVSKAGFEALSGRAA